jgi:hypothetical protein
MRLLLLSPLLLVGCAPVAAGLMVGSVPALHRTPVDALVSVVTGRDCSVVRLDAGKTYCKPPPTPLETPEFCTRSLGVPDCWVDPEDLPDHPREIADGPRTLTKEQMAHQMGRWPHLW